MTGPELGNDRDAPEDPARPGADADPGRESTVPGAGTTAAGGAADAAEPAGDQDPAVEAERVQEADRLRDTNAGGAPQEAEAAHGGDGADTDPLGRAEAQRDEYLALAQRAQADFDNYRKRATRDIAAAGARAKAELVRALLPVVDNLERALASTDDDDAGLAEGIRLVHSELVAALERSGVVSIEPAGERFDPNVHEALSTRAENGTDPGVVLDVVQKGYRLDQAVLRPARVVVAA